MWIPVTKAWQLNERHYGALQGSAPGVLRFCARLGDGPRKRLGWSFGRAMRVLSRGKEELGLLGIPRDRRRRIKAAGLDKQQTVDKHGIEQVSIWRRSYDVPPPDLDKASPMWPGNDPKYAKLDKAVVPCVGIRQ